MKKYTLTEIKAVAYGDTEVQDAILVHDNEYEFEDQDVIIFGYSMEEFDSDNAVDEVLVNEYCPTCFCREDGIYYAN